MFVNNRVFLIFLVLVSGIIYLGYSKTVVHQKPSFDLKAPPQMSIKDEDLDQDSEESEENLELTENEKNSDTVANSNFNKKQAIGASISNEKVELTPSQVEEIVKNYLHTNPQVISESLEKLQQVKMEELQKNIDKELANHNEEIYNNPTSPVIGNINAKNTVVMLYDYNCGYCKKANTALTKLLEKNSNVKVIYKPFPILNSDSEYLARISLALYNKHPEKFRVINDELLLNKEYNKDDLENMFKINEINFSDVELFSKSSEITSEIKKILDFARKLKINGVPAMIINGKYYPGYLSFEQLLEHIPETVETAPQIDSEPLMNSDNQPMENSEKNIEN